jgi:predicted membrane protein
VKVSETAGSMNLVMNGTYSAPMNLNVNNTSGGTTIDLTGTWKADMQGDIQSTAGGVTVKLPRDVGVRVTTNTTAGDVEAQGLTASSPNTYVNAAYATARVRIELNVDSTAGSIELQQF